MTAINEDWRRFAPTTRRPVDKCFISLSKDNLCFSADFVRLAGIKDYDRIVILVHEKLHYLGFQFSNQDSTGALAFYSNKNQKLCSARLLVGTYPWLAEVAKKPPIERQFVPEFDQKSKMWIIKIEEKQKIEEE